MFTAEITGKEIINGVLRLYVRYTDGQNVVTQELSSNDPTQEWVDSQIQAKIDNLENLVAFEKEVKVAKWKSPSESES